MYGTIGSSLEWSAKTGTVTLSIYSSQLISFYIIINIINYITK